MILTKTFGATALFLLLIPAGQALAYAPHDLGSFQTQCIAQGGTFGVGQTANSYECGYLDGSIESCNFDLADPVCLTRSGPAHKSPNDSTKIAGPITIQLLPPQPLQPYQGP